MLSFAVYYALKHPRVYARLQSEVDSVLAGEPIRMEHLNKLPYVVGAPN
jgi:cytochrome P450